MASNQHSISVRKRHRIFSRTNYPILLGWKRLNRLLICLNLVGLFALWVTAAHAAESPAELLIRPMYLEQGSEIPDPVPAMSIETEVHSVVTGHIIRTTVIQKFQNPSNSWVEGVYYFPLPDKAAVDRMKLKIGDRTIVSEIQEKQQAKKTYQDAAKQGKVAALLEQYRPNTFSTKVANIEPGSEISVEIAFQTLASQKSNIFSYVMPQIITPRYNPDLLVLAGFELTPEGEIPQNVNGGYRPQVSYSIHFQQGSEIKDIWSDSHLINKAEGENGEIIVSLKGGEMPAGKDFTLNWQFVQADVAKTLLFKEQKDGETYVLGLVLPPESTDELPRPPREVIFILDVSGSMQGEGIEQGKQALTKALGQLREKDYFQVIIFNNQSATFFPISQPATEKNIKLAAYGIARLKADGGTEMYPALEAALDQPMISDLNRQVVFLTDGAVTNEEQMFNLVDRKLNGARLFTVGLGYAPNSWFMRKAAEFGRGVHIQIDNIQNTSEKLSELFHDMSAPSFRDVQLDAGHGSETYPRLIPDLFGQRPVVFLSRQRQGSDTISLKGLSADGKFSELEVNQSGSLDQAGISKLWAHKKVEALIDAGARGMDHEMVRQGILDVALHHQIMSPYTSFVAVDKTPARIREEFKKRAQMQPPAANLAKSMRVSALATATPLKANILFAMIAFALAGVLLVFAMRGGVRK
ncbi:marine proteobacterial sortase target protein [Sneathiella limimaris]|uniref:marine proteobacterial sortase target protein n=1 Tax=Sneathiella limimaris TaxID=1964213 RepID=UPI00146E14EA|nr:marine proteobacterial sortase target protein [Sneathiella limimaris]